MIKKKKQSTRFVQIEFNGSIRFPVKHIWTRRTCPGNKRKKKNEQTIIIIIVDGNKSNVRNGLKCNIEEKLSVMVLEYEIRRYTGRYFIALLYLCTLCSIKSHRLVFKSRNLIRAILLRSLSSAARFDCRRRSARNLFIAFGFSETRQIGFFRSRHL